MIDGDSKQSPKWINQKEMKNEANQWKINGRMQTESHKC